MLPVSVSPWRHAGRRGLATLLGVGVLGIPGPGAADAWRDLVEAGRRAWQVSPGPAGLVACRTCHPDDGAPWGWAVSFPRFRPLPPPHARVMTLLQATAEAVARHYPGVDAGPTAEAISAYLADAARELPISPGALPGEPRFPRRLAALRASVARGAQGFAGRCGRCHAPVSVAPVAVRWWKLVRAGRGPAEVFLASHAPGPPPFTWDGAAMADLLAYLMMLEAGRPFGEPRGSTLWEVAR
jgi:cytochrome c553